MKALDFNLDNTLSYPLKTSKNMTGVKESAHGFEKMSVRNNEWRLKGEFQLP